MSSIWSTIDNGKNIPNERTKFNSLIRLNIIINKLYLSNRKIPFSVHTVCASYEIPS